MLITDQQQIITYYDALVNKDPSYVGIFFGGLKPHQYSVLQLAELVSQSLRMLSFLAILKIRSMSDIVPVKFVSRPKMLIKHLHQ